MTPARSALILAARSIVNLTEPSDELGVLVDPVGSPGHQGQIERLSLCQLVYRGLLLRAFPDIPTTLSQADRPYVPASIPRILHDILGGSPGAMGGACRPATLESPPDIGDGLWWGAAGAHPEHVDAAVLEVDVLPGQDPSTQLYLTVVAGGQRDARGHETVARVERSVLWSGGRWVCRMTGRPLLAVLCARRLGELYPAADVEPVAVAWAPVDG